MKKRFSEEQIIHILREADTHGNNLDLWRRRYQGLAVSELQRLKRLESENVKLKRLVAERALALQTLQEVLQKKGLL